MFQRKINIEMGDVIYATITRMKTKCEYDTRIDLQGRSLSDHRHLHGSA